MTPENQVHHSIACLFCWSLSLLSSITTNKMSYTANCRVEWSMLYVLLSLTWMINELMNNARLCIVKESQTHECIRHAVCVDESSTVVNNSERRDATTSEQTHRVHQLRLQTYLRRHHHHQYTEDGRIGFNFKSHQTHFRSYRRRFLRARWSNQQCQSTEAVRASTEEADIFVQVLICRFIGYFPQHSHLVQCTWHQHVNSRRVSIEQIPPSSKSSAPFFSLSLSPLFLPLPSPCPLPFPFPQI